MDQTIKRMKDVLRTEKLQHEKQWSDRSDQMDVLSAIRELEISNAEQSAINCAEQTRNYYARIATEAAARDYLSLYSLETENGMIAVRRGLI